MKVTDLKENEVIHCETEEQANAICKLMHEAGLNWSSGTSYLEENYFIIHKKETCYYPCKGVYDDLEFFKKEGFTIYKAEQFLKQKTMTRTRVLFEEVEEKKLKPIEFKKVLKNSFEFSESFISTPKDYDEVILITRNYTKGLDIILAKDQ